VLGEDPGANLADAHRLFDRFGAAPLRRTAAAELRSRKLTVPRRAAARSAGLTETEVQLVRLVMDGLSNRQVASAMHYSPKTIEVYLSRVYAKTGFGSRLELMRAVDAGQVSLDA
jgi:DNA-binding NarL/FixJ family response regulator